MNEFGSGPEINSTSKPLEEAKSSGWEKWKSIYDQRKALVGANHIPPITGMNTQDSSFTETGMSEYVIDTILQQGISDSKELSQFLIQKLAGSVLTDVACGTHGIEGALRLTGHTLNTFQHEVATSKDIGTKQINLVDAFVRVEDLKRKYLTDPSFSLEEKQDIEKRIQSIQRDALEYLIDAPTESQNIFISSVDKYVIKNDAYHKRVAQEVFRVVPENGIFFCTISDEIEREAKQLFPYSLELPMNMFIFSKSPLPTRKDLNISTSTT